MVLFGGQVHWGHSRSWINYSHSIGLRARNIEANPLQNLLFFHIKLSNSQIQCCDLGSQRIHMRRVYALTTKFEMFRISSFTGFSWTLLVTWACLHSVYSYNPATRAISSGTPKLCSTKAYHTKVSDCSNICTPSFSKLCWTLGISKFHYEGQVSLNITTSLHIALPLLMLQCNS